MQLEEKKQFVKEFKEELKEAKSIILTQYQGLKVNSINELRKKLQNAGCKMQVVKNRLALKSIEEAGIESYSSIRDFFKGPIAVLLGKEDPSQAIKIFKGYADDNKLMEFRAAVIRDNFIDVSQIEKIATLPSREVMLAKTVMTLNAPIQGLCNSLAGVIKKLFYALNDVKIKIEKGEIKVQEPKSSVTDDEEKTVNETRKEELMEDNDVKESNEESKEKITEEKDNIETQTETVQKEELSETEKNESEVAGESSENDSEVKTSDSVNNNKEEKQEEQEDENANKKE